MWRPGRAEEDWLREAGRALGGGSDQGLRKGLFLVGPEPWLEPPAGVATSRCPVTAPALPSPR